MTTYFFYNNKGTLLQSIESCLLNKYKRSRLDSLSLVLSFSLSLSLSCIIESCGPPPLRCLHLSSSFSVVPTDFI